MVSSPAEANTTKARISVTYFAHADEDCLVECIDGSNMYEPVVAKDYLKQLYQRIYAKLEK